MLARIDGRARATSARRGSSRPPGRRRSSRRRCSRPTRPCSASTPARAAGSASCSTPTVARRSSPPRRSPRSSRWCARRTTSRWSPIDIPIGLPDSERPRGRRRGPPRAGRQVVLDLLHARARRARGADLRRGPRGQPRRHRERTSVSAQAYALREKVLQVDAWVRARPGVEVVEVHPELSFARMAGAPILASKKDSDGVRARREALAAHGIVAPPWFRGVGLRRGRPARRLRGGVVGRTPLARGRRVVPRRRPRSSPTGSPPRSGSERAQPECVSTP